MKPHSCRIEGFIEIDADVCDWCGERLDAPTDECAATEPANCPVRTTTPVRRETIGA